jgi:hypothetical protein
VRFLAVEGEVSPPEPGQKPSRRMLSYGSSITQGIRATRPTGTFAMLTAHALGAELIDLGFGGGCHLEPELADYIAGREDWDFGTLELGINLVGGISSREFARRVDYFVPTVAEAHKESWIFCMDLFTCERDFQGDAKIREFREAVGRRVRELALPRLLHVPGTEMLTDPAGLTLDLVHPSDSGMAEIARNLSGLMAATMGEE